MEYNKL